MVKGIGWLLDYLGCKNNWKLKKYNMKKIVWGILFALQYEISSGQQTTCDHPKFHEFDFWIGDWTVYKQGTDSIVGYNSITRVAGQCALQENWLSVDRSSVGTSLNKFAWILDRWQQFWVDNSGLTLFLEGEFKNNSMILQNERTQQGVTTKNKITWFNNSDGTVRQLWESSQDGGKQWSVVFDGLYKKK